MSRCPRTPGTRGHRALFVLPEIRDELDPATKNALAIRIACATEGRCPGCGVVGVLYPHAKFEGIWHYTFQHEHWCPALTDEAA